MISIAMTDVPEGVVLPRSMPLPEEEDWFSAIPFSTSSSSKRKNIPRRVPRLDQPQEEDSCSDEWEKQAISDHEDSSSSQSCYASSSVATPSQNDIDDTI